MIKSRSGTTAPSDYLLGSEAVSVATPSTLVAVLTKNDGVTHNISGVSVSGTNAGDFVLESGTQPGDTAMVPNCVGVTTLGAGASCNLHIIFTPTIAGAESGKIVINDDANNSLQTVYLTGVGH